MLHRIKDIIRTSIPDLEGRAELRQKIAAHPDTFDPAPMMTLIDIVMDKLTKTALSALDTDRYSQVLRSLGRQVIAWTRWNLKITAEEEIQRDRTWKRQVRSDLGGKSALVRWDLMQRRARNRILSFSPFHGGKYPEPAQQVEGDGGSGNAHLTIDEQSRLAPHRPTPCRAPATSPRRRGEGGVHDLPDYSQIFGPIKPAADWVADFDARDAETKNTPSTPITPVWPQANTGAHLPNETTDTAGTDSRNAKSKIKTDRDGLFRLAKIARPMTAPRQVTRVKTTRRHHALVGPWQPIELTSDELRDAPDHPAQKGYWPKDMRWLKAGETESPPKEHPD